MDEIISGVHVIKMYAWEVPFSKLLALARRKELDVVRKSNYLRALYMTFILFTTRVAIFATMLSMVLLYGTEQITADKIFMIYSYFNVVSYAMTQTFVRGVAEIAEALVSFKRIQNFLESDEKVVGAITGTDTSAVVSWKNLFSTFHNSEGHEMIYKNMVPNPQFQLFSIPELGADWIDRTRWYISIITQCDSSLDATK